MGRICRIFTKPSTRIFNFFSYALGLELGVAAELAKWDTMAHFPPHTLTLSGSRALTPHTPLMLPRSSPPPTIRFSLQPLAFGLSSQAPGYGCFQGARYSRLSSAAAAGLPST